MISALAEVRATTDWHPAANCGSLLWCRQKAQVVLGQRFLQPGLLKRSRRCSGLGRRNLGMVFLPLSEGYFSVFNTWAGRITQRTVVRPWRHVWRPTCRPCSSAAKPPEGLRAPPDPRRQALLCPPFGRLPPSLSGPNPRRALRSEAHWILSSEENRLLAPLQLPTGCLIRLRGTDPIQSTIATVELSINDAWPYMIAQTACLSPDAA